MCTEGTLTIAFCKGTLSTHTGKESPVSEAATFLTSSGVYALRIDKLGFFILLTSSEIVTEGLS